MTPRISIIIPAYNALRFLPQTVASALAQTWQDFELLVVDDGSTDATSAWVAQHPDARVQLIQQTNQGAATARNTGIAATRGAYIAFLDADDLWEPTKLEKQVECLEAQPKVGLVHTAIRYIDENNREINRELGTQGDGDVWKEVVVYNPVRCGSTPLIRRACFEKVGVFDPGFSFAEDWDMWIRIAAHYHFAVLNEPLVLYRQHEDNMTKGYQAIMPNFIRIIERAFQNAAAENNSLKQEAYGRAYLFAAGRAFGAGDPGEADTLLRQAFEHYPKLRYTKSSIKLGFQLHKTWWLGQARGR